MLGCQGRDFLLKGVFANVSKLFEKVAHFRDMWDIMGRILQQLPFLLSDDEVNTSTLHTYRHMHTTAMRQTRFSCDDIEDAGHWMQVSVMCGTYDSADCVV